MSCFPRNISCGVMALAWSVAPFAVAFAQSPNPPSEQTASQEKQDSVAEAARKAKARKAIAPSKVITEDDLSGMKKEGVSVVGTAAQPQTKKGAQAAVSSDANADDSPNSEKYWRNKARPILEDMAAIDQRINQLREDIKKYGTGGVDVTTGFKDSVAYVEDRNGQIQLLEKRKATLQKKLDDVEEEGRKAGAQPAWFR